MINPYSLLYRLDFTDFKSKSSVSKHLFKNLLEKNQKQTQRETHNKHPPKPKQQLFAHWKAQLHSHRAALTQNSHTWHWGSFHRVDLCWLRPTPVRKAQGRGSTELPSQGTEPVSQCFSVGSVLKNLQEHKQQPTFPPLRTLAENFCECWFQFCSSLAEPVLLSGHFAILF